MDKEVVERVKVWIQGGIEKDKYFHFSAKARRLFERIEKEKLLTKEQLEELRAVETAH